MSVREKHRKIRHLKFSVLPCELHFRLPQFDNLDDLIDEVEIRAGMLTSVKLTDMNITLELLEGINRGR